MPESARPFSSIVMALMLIAGGLITLAAGAGYMDNPDVYDFVAALDIVAGLALVVGGICCLVGTPRLWKVCFGAVAAEAVAGVGMMTYTLLGGILLVAISGFFIWWLHTSAIRRWFGV